MKEENKGVFKGVLISLIGLIYLVFGIGVSYLSIKELILGKWELVIPGVMLLVLTELWYLLFCLNKKGGEKWYVQKAGAFAASFFGMFGSMVLCLMITVSSIDILKWSKRIDWIATVNWFGVALFWLMVGGFVILVHLTINESIWSKFKPKGKKEKKPVKCKFKVGDRIVGNELGLKESGYQKLIKGNGQGIVKKVRKHSEEDIDVGWSNGSSHWVNSKYFDLIKKKPKKRKKVSKRKK